MATLAASGDSAAIRTHAAFIWSVADLLRGDYKQSEYGKVILPLVVLRRLDCVLEPTKEAVLERHEALRDSGIENVEPVLCALSGEQFYNVSKLTLSRLLDDPANIADNLMAYIQGFSPGAKEVIERFDFAVQVERLNRSKLLYLVVSRFCEIDLHPDTVSNLEMGYLYEELIRRFSELSNETAGEHFTPREVIHLMVNLLFIEDDDALSKPGVVRTLYDPACGTGGMLSIAEDHLRKLNPGARLEVFGQELNAETYAICRSDMMLKGQDASHITFGNSFTEDGARGRQFDYMLANPPFGVEWKKVADEIKEEAAKLGYEGRFGAGLPRVNDGSFLFLQHMLSKMKPVEDGGSRLAIVFNGSPLFTGAAGSGESEIRRWIIENDWLEAVVALPDQLFYNTGISTYFWVVTNRKRPERQGNVQLVDSREFFTKMRKSLGEKRKEISPEQIDEITRLYGALEANGKVKIFRNEQFGYQRITVERPLRLCYQVSEDSAETLASSNAYVKLAPADQEHLIAALSALNGFSSIDSKQALAAVAGTLGSLNTDAEKAILDAITIRGPDAPIITKKGKPEPDPDLRDNENVALPDVAVSYEADPSERLASAEYRQAIDEYVEVEVLPYDPDAWIDYSKTKIGYEIPLTRHFYRYQPPRPLAQIDSEIRGLEEDVQALVTTDAIRGGLGGKTGVPTSLPWVDQCPPEWPVAKLSLVAHLGSGHTPSREHLEWWENCTIPWITTGEVAQMRDDRIEFITKTREMVSNAGIANSSAELHPAGTVVLCRTASAGYSAIMGQPMATSQDFVTWTCGPLLRPRFLLLCLRAMRQDLLGRLAMGSTHKTIYMPDIESIRVPLPPVAEQDRIVEAVWERLRQIDDATEKLTAQTDLLLERRQALITAAVAGQLDSGAAT